MIELLLEAERALSVGLLDQAERLYRHAADGDPRNSIAVVGLARVALERGDDREAYLLGRRALDIDPQNQAAVRLVDRLAEVMAHRGETAPVAGTTAEPKPAPAATSPARTQPRRAPSPPARPIAKRRLKKGSLLARLFGRPK
jgi:hypothetical protein